MRIDSSGEYYLVIIGALAGAGLGALFTWLEGGSDSEIILSAICGAISGGFAASGLGGLGGQIAIGFFTGAVDNGYQNLNSIIEGEISIEQAILQTLSSAVISAAFSAVGYDGTDTLLNRCNIRSVRNAAQNVLDTPGTHPALKKVAKQTIRQNQTHWFGDSLSQIATDTAYGTLNFITNQGAEYYIQLGLN